MAVFFLSGLFYGCNQAHENVTVKPTEITAPEPPKPILVKDSVDHTLYPAIYAFMKELIRLHQLDTSYGLQIEPEINVAYSSDEKSFLKKYLIEKKKEIPQLVVTKDTIGRADSLGEYSFTLDRHSISFSNDFKCLTNADISYMINNKPDLERFKWDNSRLGFNLANHQNYYGLSIPLFSIDHKTAIIMIEALCPGLCGTGNTYLFRKKNAVWKKANKSLPWIH
jgi:hypothetical protein